jgi:hypothetical protein
VTSDHYPGEQAGSREVRARAAAVSAIRRLVAISDPGRRCIPDTAVPECPLSRITTFLMLVSASIISLALIGQVTRFDRRFITFALCCWEWWSWSAR